jgi:hypothetical protein
MKILALEKETPGVTAEDFRPHARAEAVRAWELYINLYDLVALCEN